MNIKDKLFALYTYYEKTRQAGHTRLMLDGVLNSTRNSLVVACSMSSAKVIKTNVLRDMGRRCKTQFTSLNGLQGLTKYVGSPLAFDNAALHVLFKEAYDRIDQLEMMLFNRDNAKNPASRE